MMEEEAVWLLLFRALIEMPQTIGRVLWAWMHLTPSYIYYQAEQKPELDLERLQLSDEAVAGMEALGKAMRASGITLGATHQEIEPYTPQPEYEEMLPAPADWKPGE